MTASTLTQLPLMAGSALLGQLSRAGLWTLNRYMRAPLASTGLLAMVTLTALAGSNALYFQTAEHPSPFFGPARADVAVLPTPAVERPVALPEVVETIPTAQPVAQPVAAPETTGSVAPIVPDAPVGNEQMFAVQKKLFELQLFTGTVDGYYGPKTATAIREFERRNGMKITGSTDSTVLEAILSSDSSGRITRPVAAEPQAVQSTPQPVVQPVQQPVAQVAQPQPAPAAPQQDQIVARLPALSPAEQVFDDVAQTAHNTIDSIIAGLEGGRGTSANTPNAPTPAVNVAVAQTQSAPQPLQPVASTQAPVQPAQVAQPAQQPQAVRAPQANTAVRVPPANDTELVTQIQRGLASLGFFHGPVDGKPGGETARAIREFENFHRYQMTGQVKPDLVELLLKAGATI